MEKIVSGVGDGTVYSRNVLTEQFAPILSFNEPSSIENKYLLLHSSGNVLHFVIFKVYLKEDVYS